MPIDGYVRILTDSRSWRETFLGHEVVTFEGLSTCSGGPWTVESARWQFLKNVSLFAEQGGDLIEHIRLEHLHQKRLEAQGYRCFTWAVLAAAKALAGGATTVQGDSGVSALPFFEAAGRGACTFWGRPDGNSVILADSLSEEDAGHVQTSIAGRTDWVLLSTKPATGAWASFLEQHGKQVTRTGKHGRGLRAKAWWQQGSRATLPLKADVQVWTHSAAVCAPEHMRALHAALNSKAPREIILPTFSGVSVRARARVCVFVWELLC